MSIKISKAAKLTNVSQYHSTFAAIVEDIPEELIQTCTSKQLAAIIDVMFSQHEKGHTKGFYEAKDLYSE